MSRRAWGKLGFRLEQLFVILAFILFMGAFVQQIEVGGPGGLDASGVDRAAEGFVLFQLLTASIFVVTGFLLLMRLPKLIHLIVSSPFITLLTALAFISVVWSVDPNLTLRRGVAIIGTTLFAFYLAIRFQPKELLNLLGISFLVAVIGSFMIAVILPSWAIHQDPTHFGDWRGAFIHKNNMGRIMALGTIVAVLLAALDTKHKKKFWLLALGCAVLVFLSGSRTGWVTAGLLLSAYPILLILRARLTVVIPAIIMLTLLIGALTSIVLSYPEETFGLIGRTPTLTGRTTLWSVAAESAWQRPWLGYGYRAFWFSEHGEQVWWQVRWQPPHGHNGFLDLWLELGFVGLSFFVISIIVYVVRSLYLFRRVQTKEEFVIAVLLFLPLIYVILTSFSAVTILAQNQLSWILYVASIGYLNTRCFRKAKSGISNKLASVRGYSYAGTTR